MDIIFAVERQTTSIFSPGGQIDVGIPHHQHHSAAGWFLVGFVRGFTEGGRGEERRGTKPSDKTHSGRTHFLTIALPPLSFGLV